MEALRRADSVLMATAEGLGWIGIGELTYTLRDDNIMMEGKRTDIVT